MMTTAAPSPTGHLDISLGEMRAAMAAEGTKKGLAGAVAAALLSLLDLIVALLAEFRAGKLAALAPQGDEGGGIRCIRQRSAESDYPCQQPPAGCQGAATRRIPAPGSEAGASFVGTTGTPYGASATCAASATHDTSEMSAAEPAPTQPRPALDDERLGPGNRARFAPAQMETLRCDDELEGSNFKNRAFGRRG
jgi:hypothetical protein